MSPSGTTHLLTPSTKPFPVVCCHGNGLVTYEPISYKWDNYSIYTGYTDSIHDWFLQTTTVCTFICCKFRYLYMTDSYKLWQSVLSFVVNLDIYTIIAYILIRDFIHWGLTVALQKFVLNIWISTGSKNCCLEWHFAQKSFNDWPS